MRTRVTLRRSVDLPVFDHNNWRDQAACRGKSNIFLAGNSQISPKSGRPQFGPNKFDAYITQRSKAICATCPVIDNCLTWALREQIPFFVYGGLSWPERYRLLRKKRLTLVDSTTPAIGE